MDGGKRPAGSSLGGPVPKRAAPGGGAPPPPHAPGGPPPPEDDVEDDVFDGGDDEDDDGGGGGEELAIDVALGEAGRNWVRPPVPAFDPAKEAISESRGDGAGEGG